MFLYKFKTEIACCIVSGSEFVIHARIVLMKVEKLSLSENGGCVILLNLWAYVCELCLMSSSGRLMDYIEIMVSLGWFFI